VFLIIAERIADIVGEGDERASSLAPRASRKRYGVGSVASFQADELRINQSGDDVES
jgi:hypothetical protein